MNELLNLKSKVDAYHDILENTEKYRNIWQESLKDFIIERLNSILGETGLKAEVEVKDNVKNLESIMLTLGRQKSGIGERISDDTTRPLIKHNGILIYQQLFNGKIEVMIVYPFIEGYNKPYPPKMVAIYRPEEIQAPFIIRHVETFLREIINWEDFDDDNTHHKPTQPIGFNLDFNVPAQQQQVE